MNGMSLKQKKDCIVLPHESTYAFVKWVPPDLNNA